MTEAVLPADPRLRSWPPEGLEGLGACPVCGCAERTLLHHGLWDYVFFVAPGEWTMWRCGGCRSGYLDPRPDEATIGLAYERYYTHSAYAPPPLPERLSKLQRARAALGNGYRNGRFGSAMEPAWPVGRLAALMLPRLRGQIDLSLRFLPRRDPAREARVLDIGCGAGEWLTAAAAAGWTACGAEPDPAACAVGLGKGFEVRQGSAEAWADAAGTFDAVTMNHVIEHVHHPVRTLEVVFSLLRPGGQLFIETPNVDSTSHDRYGANWRGLEPPRHLALFNPASMEAALREAGFAGIRHRRRPSPLDWMNEASARIAAGRDPYDEAAAVQPPAITAAERRRSRELPSREFITLTCIRPA